jgi:hypothetical protein
VPRKEAVAECGPFDYHVSVHRFDRANEYLVYPIQLEQKMPPIAVPVLPGDPDVMLDLQMVFDQAYDAGPYHQEVDYNHDAVVPPLRPEQSKWASGLMKASR